jgi:hypothetical protein
MADVKEDPGAGVGKSGVQTPWETGNLGNTTDWNLRSRGATSPNDMNENRKNSADTGREWDHPWEHPSSPLGTLGQMDKNDSGKA